MDLPKAYNPKEAEDQIYQQWEDSGYFNPDNLPGERPESFSIAMPPPNVTGILHLGHAMENTIMDIEVRFERMRGKKAILIPGTDHAAVATQARVEQDLIESAKYQNPRQELGREKLLEIVRDYAESSKETILKQIKKLGTSCDWSRLAYTFDGARSEAVNEIFIRMYQDSLIYRGHRIINWDPKLQTTVSDDELEWAEEKAPFYYFQYGPFEIGTARPETKFGDKYVVMHPDDKRYARYKHGDTFEAEWINGTVTATVIKDEAVDPEFGTGVMTITPWHDTTDFEIAERHGLEKEQIIDWRGHLLPIAGEFADLFILKARPKIVEKLKQKGLLTRIDEDYTHRVARSDRGKALVEPQIKEQWFVDVNQGIPGRGKSLKDLMREAVTVGHKGDKNQKVKIQPEHYHKIYLHWIDNLRDWCISRQIWWGHRIPAWYKNGETKVSIESPGKDWEQDPDTLDTWFSSGTWTFSILGWPASVKTTAGKSKKTGDLESFHPNSWMQMGHEILFFWMARMILLSTYALDEIPFKDVYIHGMLKDEQGRKFSKSLRNAVDPLEVIEQYGTDALRLAVVTGISPGSDSRFYDEKIKYQKNFINKLWNIARFTIMQLETVTDEKKNVALTLTDQWILSRLNNTIQAVTADLEKYRFSQASEKLQEFTWHELADWYLEIAKRESNKQDVLIKVIDSILKLFHPFIPFVTEHIWSQLENLTNKKSQNAHDLLLIQGWPEADIKLIDDKVEKEFSQLQELVTTIRNWKAEQKIPSKEKTDYQLRQPVNEEQKNLIEHLANVQLIS